MMVRQRNSPGLLLLIIFFLAFFILKYDFAQQTVPEAQIQENQVKKEPEKIVPAPKSIKEATGIYVFLAWMWVAIFVIIYFLRLKIKEVDRLYRLKFFSSEKK